MNKVIKKDSGMMKKTAAKRACSPTKEEAFDEIVRMIEQSRQRAAQAVINVPIIIQT